MAISPEDVEILNSLGLTINAAKIFLALSERGTAAAKTIAKSSGVAREIVYQIMPSLIQKGLVEEALTTPKSFIAIPLKEAYKLLLQRKKQEHKKISQKIDTALKKQKARNHHIEDKDQVFTITIDKQKNFRIAQEYQKAQKSVDMTFPLGKFLQWSQHFADLCFRKLMEKNVKMRIITEAQLLKISNSTEIFSPDLLSKFKRVGFKYVEKSPSVEIMIFDKKTMFVSIKKTININKMRWLYTNNPFLLEMANNYYETLWKNAKEAS